MAISGVTVHDDVITAFQELKTKKNARYLLTKIDTGKIVLTSKGGRDESYDDFLGKLAKDQPCYAVFDYEYEVAEGKRDKLLLVSWIPDAGKPKEKMHYASSKAAIVNALEGGVKEIHASDISDLSPDAILKKIQQKH